jgi:hypothetical protein
VGSDEHELTPTFSVAPKYRPAFNLFVEEVLSVKGKNSCEVGLLPTDQRPEVMVRIEAVADESGQECRMVVMNISAEQQAEEFTRCKTTCRLHACCSA